MAVADREDAVAQQGDPRVWLVIGDKLGDNAQAEFLVETLGWPYTRKELRFKARYVHGKPRFRPSLAHLDQEASAVLAPPWPELIVTVGRRPAMAALWVRRRSGGRTKVVLIGRPRRGFDHYALVLAPPQYRVPARGNVLSLELPLMRVEEAALAEARERWRPELATLPRPLTALLVGGPTRPFRFDAAVARDLLARTRGAAGEPGTLYVTTSRRTPAAVSEALAAALPEGERLYRWTPEAAANPYLGLLAHADRFVVTGDSISMMTEVARLGRPLAIYPLPVRHPRLRRLQGAATTFFLPDGEFRSVRAGLGAALFRLGLIGYERDLGRLHRQLFARGMAAPLGEPFSPSGPAADDLGQVAGRLRALLEPGA